MANHRAPGDSHEHSSEFWGSLGFNLTSRGPGPSLVLALGPDSNGRPGQNRAPGQDFKSVKEGALKCRRSVRCRAGTEALGAQVTFVTS